jgi:hypothetical protein
MMRARGAAAGRGEDDRSAAEHLPDRRLGVGIGVGVGIGIGIGPSAPGSPLPIARGGRDAWIRY